MQGIDAGTLLTCGAYLVSVAAMWGSQRTRLAAAEKRIENLEGQRANEIRLTVEVHAKKLDEHDAVLAKLSDTLTACLLKLERIEAAVAGGARTPGGHQ